MLMDELIAVFWALVYSKGMKVLLGIVVLLIVLSQVGAMMRQGNEAAAVPTLSPEITPVPTALVTPAPSLAPTVTPNPDVYPGSGHIGVTIVHYRYGDEAVIDLGSYEASGGHVVYTPQSVIDSGAFMAASVVYWHDGRRYEWPNVQAYYDRTTGNLVSSLVSSDGVVLDGCQGNKALIDAGRMYA